MDISLFFSLLLLGFLARASCETCPPPEDISPCLCTPWKSSTPPTISVQCYGVNLEQIDYAFYALRGKTISSVYIKNFTGDKLPSPLFRDTHIRYISIFDSNLRVLSESEQRPAFLGLENSLEELRVDNSIKGNNQLKTLALSHLKKLRILSLLNNNIPEVGNDWFAKGPLNLTNVNFFKCGLSKLGDKAFAPLANLQELELRQNRITSIDRSMIPNPASHLKILALRDNSLTRLQNDSFSRMPLLREVYLSSNSIKLLEEKTWSSVWETLTDLYLSDNPLECAYHMKWMFSLKRPTSLSGTCDSPASVKGQRLPDIIDKNRKLLSKNHYKMKS